jgi:hypothetical protein
MSEFYVLWDSFCQKYSGYDASNNVKLWNYHHNPLFNINKLIGTMRKKNEKLLLSHLHQDKIMKSERDYHKYKTEFELHCCKILNPICYYDDGTMHTYQQLFDKYRDHKYTTVSIRFYDWELAPNRYGMLSIPSNPHFLLILVFFSWI